MQPPSEPEDIHVILSRFHTWAGKNPGVGNGKASVPATAGVREIPYEEAMRNFRQRRKGQTRRATALAAPPAAAAPILSPDPPPANPQEALPASVAPEPVAEPALEQASTEIEPQPAALATRPAALAIRTPALPQPSEKKAPKKTVTRPAKKAATEPPPIQQALVPLKPKPLQAKPAPAQRKASAPSRPKPRRNAATKKSTALALGPRTAEPSELAFRSVLAKTVRSASSSAQSKSKALPKPDRDRRITTRFSAAEQRRLERAADQAGLSVSAWLRQCALQAEVASAPSSPKAGNRPRPAPEPTLFSTPAPSGLGSWLTLLRQRFLSSPARFSERA